MENARGGTRELRAEVVPASRLALGLVAYGEGGHSAQKTRRRLTPGEGARAGVLVGCPALRAPCGRDGAAQAELAQLDAALPFSLQAFFFRARSWRSRPLGRFPCE